MHIVLTILLLVVPPKNGKPLYMKDIAPAMALYAANGAQIHVVTPDGKPFKGSIPPAPKDYQSEDAYNAIRDEGTLFPKMLKPGKLASIDPSEPYLVIVWGSQTEARKNKTVMDYLKKAEAKDKPVLWLIKE